ncbi:MAG: hypothetical protein ABIR96_13090 [Bdellovibrionota bacterium]
MMKRTFFKPLLLAATFSPFVMAASGDHELKTSSAAEQFKSVDASGAALYKNCAGDDGQAVRAEIQNQVFAYEANLTRPGRSSVAQIESFKNAREAAKLQLMNFISTYDVSCFKGIASLDYLCAQLSSEVSIKTKEGLSYPLKDGYTLVRKKIPKTGELQSSWSLVSKDGQILALLTDKDHNGFPDVVSLSGAWGTHTDISSRKVMGLETDIEEKSAAVAATKDVNLLTDARYQSLTAKNVQPAQACVELGNPAALLSLVADGEGWSADQAHLSFGKQMGYMLQGASEGAQKGERGLLKGLEAAGVSTWEGLKGLVSIAGTLGKGSYSYAMNAATRAKVHAGIGTAFAKAGAAYGAAWSDCARDQSNLYVITFCMDRKIVSATGQGVGKMLGAVGAQLKKCWTGDGAEFHDEYFSECMGQVVFVTGTSAIGGGLYQAGGKAAVLSENVAVRVAGRGAAFLGEWVLDQTGLGTMGPSALKKLGDVLKVARKEAGALIDNGKLAMNAAESLELKNFLEAQARSTGKAAGEAPHLSTALEKKITDADPQALERWKKGVTTAVAPDDVSGYVADVTKGLKLNARGRSAIESYIRSYRDAYGNDISPTALEHMSRIAKNWQPDEIESMVGIMDGVKKTVGDSAGFGTYVEDRSRLIGDQIKSLEASQGTHATNEEFYANRLKQLQEESKDLRNSNLDPVAARRSAARHELRYAGQSEDDIAQMLECFR